DIEPIRLLEGEAVVELQRQDHGLDVVEAVLPAAQHPKEHVELGGGEAGDPAGSASAIRAKSPSASCSGRDPDDTSASARSASGSGTPRRRTAARIVLPRCPNASSTTRNRRTGSTSTGGRSWRVIQTTAEATEGRGQNTSRGTRRTSSTVPEYAIRMPVGP